MEHIHKRFTIEQVNMILRSYCQGVISRNEVEEVLGIGKTRFFAILKAYRENPESFSMNYERDTPIRLSREINIKIEEELLRDKALIDDPDLPINTYNYTALRDRLKKHGVSVSIPTIIRRAKTLGCYKTHHKRKVHDREVITTAIGSMIQHDASLHKWSPYADEKWTLITSIDDYSRKLLYAEFVPEENTWAHIQAVQTLTQKYGFPLQYYVDNLRVFRFVQKRDSFWRNHILQTDEVDPQWRQVMRLLGIDVVYALSPQAKGKVERPYRWLQERIVRTCALEKLSTYEDVCAVLKEELHRYNDHQVHSSTGDIPSIRFEKAKNQGLSLFRPFVLPKSFTSPKDVFCFRETRMVNGYRRISIFGKEIEIPKVPLREDVNVHWLPDLDKHTLEFRVWWNNSLVHSVIFPMSEFRVHF